MKRLKNAEKNLGVYDSSPTVTARRSGLGSFSCAAHGNVLAV